MNIDLATWKSLMTLTRAVSVEKLGAKPDSKVHGRRREGDTEYRKLF